jgi:hypothetical protein
MADELRPKLRILIEKDRPGNYFRVAARCHTPDAILGEIVGVGETEIEALADLFKSSPRHFPYEIVVESLAPIPPT